MSSVIFKKHMAWKVAERGAVMGSWLVVEMRSAESDRGFVSDQIFGTR